MCVCVSIQATFGVTIIDIKMLQTACFPFWHLGGTKHGGLGLSLWIG